MKMIRYPAPGILTVAVFAILLLPDLFKEGLFVDGLIYATLANNRAEGLGSFWFPYYSATFLSTFHEHPPLVFNIQGLFFRFIGHSFYVEKIYSLFMAVLSAMLIIKIWTRILSPTKYRELYWLPVILWITIPKCCWSYSNNMLENTMGLFSMAAVYALIRSIHQSFLKQFFYLASAAGLLMLSFLSKGFPGLFPLAFFICYLLVSRDWKNSRGWINKTLILFTLFASCFGLLFYFSPGAMPSLQKYMEGQVIKSLNGERVVGPRGFMLQVLVQETAVLMGLALIGGLIAVLKKIRFVIRTGDSFSSPAFFLLLAFSASIPLLLSPKQLSFYIVPSLPYFAIAAALWIAPVIHHYLTVLSSSVLKSLQYFSYVLLLIAFYFSISNYGKYIRDEQMIKDAGRIGADLPQNSTIGISPALQQNWGLRSYFQRKFHIHLTTSPSASPYLLFPKGSQCPKGYQELPIQLTSCCFWKKRANPLNSRGQKNTFSFQTRPLHSTAIFTQFLELNK